MKGPRVDRALPERILSDGEVRRLISGAGTERDRLLLKFIYIAGLRVSEAVKVTWGDLSEREDSGQVSVLGKGGKVRAILLSPALWVELMNFKPEGAAASDFVFVSRNGRGFLHPSQVLRILKGAARGAGLKEEVSPHWLRHAHATHDLEKGCPVHLVKETLGHASIAVTGRYLHARSDDSSARYLG